MKQYLPMKPVKHFKDLGTCRQPQWVCVRDTGKKGETTVGGSVVTRLTQDLVGKVYHILMDSFFRQCHCIMSYYHNIYCTGSRR